MRKRVLAVAALAGSLVVGLAPLASAAVTVCYDVQVSAAGTQVVSQSGCQTV